MHVTFGGDDGNDEDVPMQEDGACTYQGGDAVIKGIRDDQDDSDLDDMF